MSRIDPNPLINSPGLQYPSDVDLDPSNPQGFALRNILDNLFYLRRVVDGSNSVGGRTLTDAQILALVNRLVIRSRGSSTSVIVGTHNTRITAYAGATGPVGQEYYETDRNSVYIISDSTGVKKWTYNGGSMYALIAARPTDLTTYDAGFLFTDITTDNETQYIWDGSEWLTIGGFLQQIDDAVTAAITTVILRRHRTSGVAGAGFGSGLVDQIEDSAGVDQTVAYETVEWTTGATVTALKRWSILIASALTQMMELAATGLTLLIGDFIWKSGTAFTGTLTHTNTANRAWEFIDFSGNIPVIVDHKELVNQAAAIVGTNLTGGNAGTQFELDYTLLTTTADAAAGSIQLTIGYTDDAGATTQVSAVLLLTALGRDKGVLSIQRASGNITYAVALTAGAFLTAKYALYLSLKRVV